MQSHMRLRASGDRNEVRMQYLPTLWDMTIRKLQNEGKESVDEVIDLMDSYFLTREDYDAMQELGVGPMDAGTISIDAQTKAAFTRIYNSRSHPVPLMHAAAVVAPRKMPREKPDIEDALGESDEGEPILGEEETKEEEDELDLKKDKLVKMPKPKKKPAAKTSKQPAKPRAKNRKKGEDDDFVEDGEPKPKKRAARKNT